MLIKQDDGEATHINQALLFLVKLMFLVSKTRLKDTFNKKLKLE